MKTYLTKIIIRTILKKNYITSNYSSYVLAKGYKQFVHLLRSQIKDFMLIAIGIFSASFGFKGFLLTNHFIDGGATGISLLLQALTQLPLYFFIVSINIPFILLAYFVIGKQFAFKTAISIAGLALCLAMVPFPNITDDNLLVALFGGFFLGAGIGLSIRGGAVIDGTEVLAIYLSKKFGLTIGDIIIIINVFIFSISAYLLGIEIAMYSMITYLSASKTLDFIVAGIDEYVGVTIVSVHHLEIKDMIKNQLKNGYTIYKGESSFGKTGEKKEIPIVYTVLTRLEINTFSTELEKIDSTAFVVMSSVKNVKK